MNDSNINFVNETVVYVDGRKVGAIKEVTLIKADGRELSYRYFPKGDSLGGESYKSLAECKASLKG